MSAVGSRRKGQGEIWNIIIPSDLAFRFETLYMDPGKKKPIYGIKSQIVSELVEKHVAQLEAELARSVEGAEA